LYLYSLLPKVEGILRKFDMSAIIGISGYSKAVVLNDWKHHLDSGKQSMAKGWIEGEDLAQLLGFTAEQAPKGEVFIKSDEEVYLVVFGKGKITANATNKLAKPAQVLESRPRSDLV
jgi:hypothetical protein